MITNDKVANEVSVYEWKSFYFNLPQLISQKVPRSRNSFPFLYSPLSHLLFSTANPCPSRSLTISRIHHSAYHLQRSLTDQVLNDNVNSDKIWLRELLTNLLRTLPFLTLRKSFNIYCKYGKEILLFLPIPN